MTARSGALGASDSLGENNMHCILKSIYGCVLILLTGCGSNPTQYSTPDNYRVSLNVSGTGVDRLKEFTEKLGGADGEGVQIESGLSPEEEAATADEINDALADALAELDSDGGHSSGQNDGAKSPSQGSSSTSTELFLIKPVESIGKVAGNVKKFITACAESMRVEEEKIKIASDGDSLGETDVLLVVIDKGLAIETKLNGNSIRGVCIYSSQGSKVTVNAGNTKVGGLLSYQAGANNETTITFGTNGKLDSGMATFSGSKNKVAAKSAKLTSCDKPYVLRLGAGTFGCE